MEVIVPSWGDGVIDVILDTVHEAQSRRRQADLETLVTIDDQVGKFELAIARMANDPAMDVAEAPELLGSSEGLFVRLR